MSDIVKTTGDHRVRIEPDTFGAQDPREWMAHEIVGHSDYATADACFASEERALRDRGMGMQFGRYLAIFHDIIAVEVHKYEHSGMALSTQSFIGRAVHARWDSGMIGWAYMPPEAMEEAGFEATEEGIKGALADEIEHLGKWFNGEVYGYIVERELTANKHYFDSEGMEVPDLSVIEKEWVEVESCWGYIGYDDAQGMAESALDTVVMNATKEASE